MSRLPALVDPLSMLVPTRVYLILIELLHPHTPLVESLAKAFEHATAEERAATLRNLETLAVSVDAVKKTVSAGAVHAQ
jgi:hypothetical protein